jgi:hypothetical protein
MKKHLFPLALLACLLCLLFDLMVWGAVKDLPDVGASLRRGAERGAPLALTYMVIGEQVDSFVPSLHAFGLDLAGVAFQDGNQRMKDDPNVALPLVFERTWNGAHRFIKLCFWGFPVLALLSAFLWWRRPRKVSLMGRR